jgi:hypothetical protein
LREIRPRRIATSRTDGKAGPRLTKFRGTTGTAKRSPARAGLPAE